MGRFILGLACAMIVSVSSAAMPANAGDFMVRVLGTGVITKDEVNSLTTSGGTDLKSAGFGAEISDEFIPAATISYFFTKNVAVELFCCFATHTADLRGGLTGEIADFWIFPPALTLQYHFTGLGNAKPYVGIGAQYIHFFDEKTGANTLGSSSVSIDDAFGFTLQAGLDLSIGRGWYLNIDAKKTWLNTEAHWRNATSGGLGGQDVRADLDIDPLIVSAGIGYKFNLGDLFRRQPPSLK